MIEMYIILIILTQPKRKILFGLVILEWCGIEYVDKGDRALGRTSTFRINVKYTMLLGLSIVWINVGDIRGYGVVFNKDVREEHFN